MTLSLEPIDPLRVAHTRPPAKLNLFLELLARRDDGYHEIDTVMVPIDWCDELRVRRVASPGVRIKCSWLPSRSRIASRLGVDESSALLEIPDDESNLVHRAVSAIAQTFNVPGGFECDLGKSIPAGAGLGGASSDAASALLCACALLGISTADPRVREIAEQIGSDVPFFLGVDGVTSETVNLSAARATGRGECLEPIALPARLRFLVVYPAVSLSTAQVYANSQVPPIPQTADKFVEALRRGNNAEIQGLMLNRLQDPAKRVAPQIWETLESLWRLGLDTCQLTGSGSACFAFIDSFGNASKQAAMGQAGFEQVFEPGALVMLTNSITVPQRVEITTDARLPS